MTLRIAIVLVSMCLAQNPTAVPAFEVASIKSSPPPTRDVRMDPAAPARGPANDPMYFTRRGSNLKLLIEWAWDVQEFQVTGGPAWIESERYDIQAKPATPASRDQMRLMLRSLLTDRFQLSLHAESRQLSAYALTIAKGGLKQGPQFRRLTNEEAAISRSRFGGPRQNIYVTDLKHFASNLTDTMNPQSYNDAGVRLPQPDFKPVIDRTGLDGIFEITVTWKAGKEPAENIEEQLGLKLNSTKAAVDILVIDHAEKIPTAN